MKSKKEWNWDSESLKTKRTVKKAILLLVYA